jgi:hypothetical protein
MKFRLNEIIQTSRTKPKSNAKITMKTTVQKLQEKIEVDFNINVLMEEVSRWFEILNAMNVFLLEFDSSTYGDKKIKSFTCKLEYPMTTSNLLLSKLLSECTDERFTWKPLESFSVQTEIVSCESKPLFHASIKHPIMRRNINLFEFGTLNDFYLVGITIDKPSKLAEHNGKDISVKSISVSPSSEETSDDPNYPIEQSVFNLPDNKRIFVIDYNRREKKFTTRVNDVLYRIDVSGSPFLYKLIDEHVKPSSSNEWFVKENTKPNQLLITSMSFQVNKQTKAKMDKYELNLKGSSK